MSAPGVIIAGAGLLLEFIAEAAPKVRGIASAFADFWEGKGLGPLPPNVAAWVEEDRRVDEALRAPSPTEPDIKPSDR